MGLSVRVKLYILIFLISGLRLAAQDSETILSRVVFNYDSVFTGFTERNTDAEVVMLDSDLRNILFEVSFADNEVFFSYFLEGFDEKWTEWTKNPIKEYTNLHPGIYSLKVKTGLQGTILSEDIFFHFKIKQPFYLSGVFLALYLLAIIVIIWLIYRKITKDHILRQARLEAIIKERTEELTIEKEKAESLLANVLPKGTADEIISKGKATKKKYNFVTVLFSDIQGFTKIAEEINPEILIDELDRFFFHFDSVAEKYNIEKIKTIGDAYMCAGGIPLKNRSNAVEVILAALEMQDYMIRMKKEQEEKGLKFWDIRIGIHTGTVIAGVVGQKKLSYDIWGDTVNTASRMESSGRAGMINISGITYENVKNFFICEYRGKMPVKYKGELDMYFVKGIRPELRLKDKKEPNEIFLNRILNIKLQDIEDRFFAIYESEASSALVFHDVKYARNICTQTELIGRAEQLDEGTLLCLRLASVFVCSGYIKSYSDPLEHSVSYLNSIAPEFGFGEKCIAEAGQMIQDSSSGNPSIEGGKILSDAINDYYGRIDYPELVSIKYNEEKELAGVRDRKKWFDKELKKISEYVLYTATARLLSFVSREDQIVALKQLLSDSK